MKCGVSYDYKAGAVARAKINGRLHQLLPGLLAGVCVWNLFIADVLRGHVDLLMRSRRSQCQALTIALSAGEQQCICILCNSCELLASANHRLRLCMLPLLAACHLI